MVKCKDFEGGNELGFFENNQDATMLEPSTLKGCCENHCFRE